MFILLIHLCFLLLAISHWDNFLTEVNKIIFFQFLFTEVSTPNLIPSELVTESSDIHDVSNNIINGDMMHKTNGFTHDLSDFEPSVNSEQTNHDLLIHDVNSMKLQDYGENVFIAADNLNNNNTDTSVNNNNNNVKDCNQMKSTGLDEYDPIASWGSPQNLPLPPTGNSKSNF